MNKTGERKWKETAGDTFYYNIVVDSEGHIFFVNFFVHLFISQFVWQVNLFISC